MSRKITNFVGNFLTLITMNLTFIQENAISLFRAYRWPTGVYCPRCHCWHVYHCKDRYKCASCGHRFSDKTGSIFHNSNLPIKTIMTGVYYFLHHKGISSISLSGLLDISQPSAWFFMTKLRFALHQGDVRLHGTVAADEVYLGGSVKWMHYKRKLELFKKFDIQVTDVKPTMDNYLALGHRKCYPVLGMTDWDQLAYIYRPAPLHAPVVKSVISDFCQDVNLLVTDNSRLYDDVGIPTERCNHKRHIYRTESGLSSNVIEGNNSWLRRQVRCHYVRPTEHYIQGYLNEYVFRRNHAKLDISEVLQISFLYFRMTRVTRDKLVYSGISA